MVAPGHDEKTESIIGFGQIRRGWRDSRRRRCPVLFSLVGRNRGGAWIGRVAGLAWLHGLRNPGICRDLRPRQRVGIPPASADMAAGRWPGQRRCHLLCFLRQLSGRTRLFGAGRTGGCRYRECPCGAAGRFVRAASGVDVHNHLSALRPPTIGGNADKCLRLFLRVPEMPRHASAQARRLLRVLFLWFCQVSADSIGRRLLCALIAVFNRLCWLNSENYDFNRSSRLSVHFVGIRDVVDAGCRPSHACAKRLHRCRAAETQSGIRRALR